MGSEDTYFHLLAGGAGGTAGAVITCPLEVVKTRLQSSVSSFHPTQYIRKVPIAPPNAFNSATYATYASVANTTTVTTARSGDSTRLYACLKYIVKNEGVGGLFKGLGPNLVGVAPSRAIYFCAYAQVKSFCNEVMPPDTHVVHICSAAAAGFTASTTTNPIWFLKTRLQLDHKRNGSLTVRQCVRDTYKKHGIKGFYKGITASYYGITETVIHFVIYESIKAHLHEINCRNQWNEEDDHNFFYQYLEFMGAGATSKSIATCIAYPHEVARTRLREEGSIYRGFWQTLHHVYVNEGVRGLYRGLTTQLVRQIPNTAIMMATYEAVIYLCHEHFGSQTENEDYDS